MAKGDDIQERLIAFGVTIVQLCSLLPKTPSASHMGNQLLRAGTSVAPNYGEVRGAESRKDFVHKLGVVLKELNECAIWLQMMERTESLSSTVTAPAKDECKELCRIMVASIKTASAK